MTQRSIAWRGKDFAAALFNRGLRLVASAALLIGPSVSAETVKLAWDASTSSNVAGYTLHYGDKSRAYNKTVDAGSETSISVTGMVAGSTYYFAVTSYSLEGQESEYSNEVLFSVPALETNRPPVLVPIASRTLKVGDWLCVTNLAFDSDLPRQTLTYTLPANAPAGVELNATNGVLLWSPDARFAGTTNFITVRVTDSGMPSRSSSRSFAVIVEPYVEVSLGSVVVLSGTSTNIPVNIVSSLSLQELQLSVRFPRNTVTNLGARELNGRGVLSATPPWVNLEVSPSDGVYFKGTQQVGSVSFTALTNRPSAFVPVVIESASAIQSDGAPFTDVTRMNARLVMINRRPLLEPTRTARGERRLKVYGRPGKTYRIESKTRVNTDAWKSTGISVLMTNTTRSVAAPTKPGDMVFYRAVEVPTLPQLKARVSSSGDRFLVVAGEPGIPYAVERSANPALPTSWVTIQTNVILSSTVEALDIPDGGGKAVFYRVRSL